MNALNPLESRDTTCPECGTDHARALERDGLLRHNLAAVTAQRDALLKALKNAVAQMEALAAHANQPGMSRSDIAIARTAIAAVEGDANVPF